MISAGVDRRAISWTLAWRSLAVLGRTRHRSFGLRSPLVASQRPPAVQTRRLRVIKAAGDISYRPVTISTAFVNLGGNLQRASGKTICA
jgi:hypothetical protein